MTLEAKGAKARRGAAGSELSSAPMLEVGQEVKLELPAEPVELRDALYEGLLNGGEWREGFSDEVCIGVWLWNRWRAALEPAGLSRERFIQIITDYRREVWLWLSGERTWEQSISGLAGRVGRRLPVE
jgi:hypothetical protein